MATSSGPPNVIGTPMATSNANQSGWATKEDWIRHQALIGQLYRKQPLAEVMAFMASQHGFRATEKMYKTRINRWGLDKKNKENEMRAIVRKNKRLGDQGKRITFRVRGRPVDYKDVVRYWERKGVRADDVIAQRTESKTPEAVDCFISLPSPKMMPEPMVTPERILVSIRDYCKGSFENGTWLATNPQFECTTTKVQNNALFHLDRFRELSIKACRLFENNYFQEAGQTLISATSEIKRILLAEHPMTLRCLFALVVYIFREERHEIALSILRQFSALARIVVGGKHPLHYICGGLASIQPSQMYGVVFRCIGSTGDHFENLAGPMNWSTLSNRLIFIQEIDLERAVSHRIFVLQGLLRKCEANLGSLDRRTCGVRIQLAWGYSDSQNHVEAVRLGWDVVACSQHLENSDFSVYVYTEGLCIVAISRYSMGETYSAEVHLREAIDLRTSTWGPHPGRVREWLMLLEQRLMEQGQLSAAAQVQKRWKETLQDSTNDS